MQIRVITLRYQEGLQGFSEEALRTATFGRQVLSVDQHFFLHGNVPHLVLTLQLADTEGGGYQRRDRNGSEAARLEEKIPEAARPVYNALRDWRNRKAKEKGCPAYNIALNVQLAELVLKAPKSIAAMREIEGCTEKFCKQYGEELLGLLGDVKPSEGGTPAQTEAEDLLVSGRDARSPKGEGSSCDSVSEENNTSKNK